MFCEFCAPSSPSTEGRPYMDSRALPKYRRIRIAQLSIFAKYPLFHHPGCLAGQSIGQLDWPALAISAAWHREQMGVTDGDTIRAESVPG